MPAKKRFEVWARDANGDLELIGNVSKLAEADQYARKHRYEGVAAIRIEDTKGEITPREYPLGNG